MKQTMAAIALIPFTFGLAGVPEVVTPRDPQPAQLFKLWPTEGVGYPGYAETPSASGESINQASVTLGVLGGVALAGSSIALLCRKRTSGV